MQDQPLISVIVPVYNAAKYLEACLDHLLAQSYTNIEIIAIDDFSSDDSYKILRRYKKLDHRLSISKNVKHYGIALTLNRCMKRAKGECIAFMNAKDMSHKDRLQQQYLYLQANEKTVAVGVQCVYLNEEDKKVGKSAFPTEHVEVYKKPLDGVTLLFDNVMVHKKRIPKDVLHFKTNQYPFIYTDIYIKLLKYGELLNLPQVLYVKRKLKDRTRIAKHPFPSLAKTWFRGITIHDHMPSLRSIFLNQLLSNLK